MLLDWVITGCWKVRERERLSIWSLWSLCGLCGQSVWTSQKAVLFIFHVDTGLWWLCLMAINAGASYMCIYIYLYLSKTRSSTACVEISENAWNQENKPYPRNFEQVPNSKLLHTNVTNGFQQLHSRREFSRSPTYNLLSLFFFLLSRFH